jgi:DNA replication and repair protein RecF
VLVRSITTARFRNLENQTVAPTSRFNVLSGENAQGKTNFLEAVYLVTTLRSFRAHRSVEMLGFGEREARVEAVVHTGGIDRELSVQLHERGRRALVDGKGVGSTAKYLETGLAAVLFTPDDVQLPRGAPSERRRMLDRAITNLWPAYLSLAREYQKTVSSRNQLLKQAAREGTRSRQSSLTTMLEVYDQQLCERGARLVAARLRYVRAMAPRVSEAFWDISRSGVEGTLHYLCPESLESLPDTDLSGIAQALSRGLAEVQGVDRARQVTTTGPHTHDLEFRLDGHSTRSYGSQGQLRALMLAFKVTQILDVFQKRNDYPVLLLDDVSSELDPARNDYLFDFISKIPCQVFLTTTRPQLVTLADNRLDFEVVSGRIEPLV